MRAGDSVSRQRLTGLAQSLAGDQEELGMSKKISPLFAIVVLAILASGLLIGLLGCSGGSTPTSSTPEQEAASTSEPAEETAALPLQATPVVDEVPEPSTDPILYAISWVREGGGDNYCDSMEILPDGTVTATACLSGTNLGSYEGTLTVEQLEQLTAWIERFAAFSRRESEVSRAVRGTFFEGKGSEVPTIEDKRSITLFAATIFFDLTGLEQPQMF